MAQSNDNFWKIHLKPTVISVIVVAVALCSYADRARVNRIQNQEKQQSARIEKLDSQIIAKFSASRQLQAAIDKKTQDSLNRIPEYVFVMQNRNRVDSLRNANDSLIKRAYKIVISDTVFGIVRKNESLFTEYSDIPQVQNIGWQYWRNKQVIKYFEQQLSAVENTSENVRTYFRKSADAKIQQLYREIDVLLTEKEQIIR